MDRLLRRVDAFLSAASDQKKKGDMLCVNNVTTGTENNRLYWTHGEWFVNFITSTPNPLTMYADFYHHWYTAALDKEFLQSCLDKHPFGLVLNKTDETTCEYGLKDGEKRSARIKACTRAEFPDDVLSWTAHSYDGNDRNPNMNVDFTATADNIREMFTLHAVT